MRIMGTREYTAQDIRSRALEFDEYLGNANHYAIKEIDDDARTLSEMLHQAADTLDKQQKLKSTMSEVMRIVSECDECDTYNRTEFCAEAIAKISEIIKRYSDVTKRDDGSASKIHDTKCVEVHYAFRREDGE